MSWDRWKSGRDMYRQAAEFLRTGQTDYNPYVQNASVQGCTDSDQCASGFACVGGNCIFIDSSAGGGDGSGSTAGCGGQVVTGPGTGPRPPQQCEAGPGNNDNSGSSASSVSSSITSGLGARRSTSCTKTGCGGGAGGGGGGGGGNGDDCCGRERCCRFGNGYVGCFCGPCPPRQGCNRYCTNHHQTFGDHADGCSGDNSCDECDSCVSAPEGGRCEPKFGSAPCWCDQEGAGCGGECQKCGEDGDCEFDESSCKKCVELRNIPCPDCAKTVNLTCCGDYNDASIHGNCYERALAKCKEGCDNEPPEQSCDGVCNDRTYCGTVPPCPSKHSCSTIESGGNCIIRRECDKSNVPSHCEPCDCSCNQDCPSCQICNESTGKCQPDPACENSHYAVVGLFKYRAVASFPCNDGTGNCCDSVQEGSTNPLYFSGEFGAPGDLGPGYTSREEVTGTYGQNICVAAIGCGSSFKTRLLFYRSDGETYAGAQYVNSDNWTEQWCAGRSFSNGTTTYVPLSLKVYTGYGNNPTEAYQDVWDQMAND